MGDLKYLGCRGRVGVKALKELVMSVPKSAQWRHFIVGGIDNKNDVIMTHAVADEILPSNH